MTDLDPDRRLALAYVPAPRRAAIGALWRLDATFGAVLAGGRDPMVGRLRLAWWRDALAALDDAPAPAEPLLVALAAHVLPAGATGAELAAMEEGWAAILPGEPLTGETLALHGERRGAALFALSARLLGGGAVDAEAAGRAWALADLARHSSRPVEAEQALAAAGTAVADGDRWPRALRPLGMLAMLARRDIRRGSDRFERPGAPARMLRMIAHRLSGR
jgi:phytoene synthase